MARPTPRLPPVITTLSIAGELSGFGDVERRHDADRGRNLMGRELVAAGAEDLLPDAAIIVAGKLRRSLVRQDHIGHDDGARDRIAPRLDERHPHPLLAVDDGLDLLGMDLEAADIDDAAAPADEIIAIAAQ